MSEWWVEIFNYDTEEMVKRIGPYKSERSAEKAEAAVNINLNHDTHYTRVLNQ